MKNRQKSVFRHFFFENVDQKIAFRKILGSVSQKWKSQNSTKGGPFGSAGGRIPDREASAPLPKSALEVDQFRLLYIVIPRSFISLDLSSVVLHISNFLLVTPLNTIFAHLSIARSIPFAFNPFSSYSISI